MNRVSIILRYCVNGDKKHMMNFTAKSIEPADKVRLSASGYICNVNQ